MLFITSIFGPILFGLDTTGGGPIPSTGGPNLLLRPDDPGFSGPDPFELPKYDGLRREDPPKVGVCADREPPDPLAPKGMLLAPDIPAP
jgi:hypothetical protein